MHTEFHSCNIKMMEAVSVNVDPLKPKAEELRREGQTVIFAASDNRAVGFVGVASAAMTFSSVSLIGNALRLRRAQL